MNRDRKLTLDELTSIASDYDRLKKIKDCVAAILQAPQVAAHVGAVVRYELASGPFTHITQNEQAGLWVLQGIVDGLCDEWQAIANRLSGVASDVPTPPARETTRIAMPHRDAPE